MRIGIDARYQGQPLTGVPRYIDELCKQLDVVLPEAKFFLYAASAQGITLPSARWILRTEPNQYIARIKPNLWWKFFSYRLIRKDALDVFWAAGGLLPGRVSNIPMVLTVYDLTFRLFPETMSPLNLWAHRLFFKRDLMRAQMVVTISQGTSDKLHHFYGRSADAVVRPDASKTFSPQPDERKQEVCAKYGLDKPYLLAVSTLEPRKNLISLIEAFLMLKRGGSLPDHELVLIGKKGWKDTALAGSIAAAEGASIRSLGFVPDADLPALYSACDLFCMPSLYEGFGIPVLEAVRCGAKVVASDIEEIREAGGVTCTYTGLIPVDIAKAISCALAFPSPDNTETPEDSLAWRLSANTLATRLTSYSTTS